LECIRENKKNRDSRVKEHYNSNNKLRICFMFSVGACI